MKVTRVETRCVTVKLDKPIGSALGQLHSFGCILVFVHCDSGIVGENLIFTLNARRTRVLQSMVEEMADLVIGRDAGHIAGFWARAWRDINFLGHKGVPVVGISALDGALWDALGKMSNLPIYRILGGAQDRVPVYHSGGLWLSSSDKELVAEAERFAAAGFRAMKMRLGSPEPATDVARVRAVRTAIGPKIKLMADANQGLTESQAIRLGRALEEFDLTWFEEPLPAWDLDGLARVAAALDTPIASGETEYTRYGFRRMLELRSADILMPDLQRVGGVSEFIRVGHMAESYDIPVSSHLFLETSLQVLGALANTIYLEYMPWFSKLYNETIKFAEGQAIVPERPGWGFTFNQDYVSHLERA
jgi:L-alanine-DL-glutamate epimerase-like enolase superfamily enzyme